MRIRILHALCERTANEPSAMRVLRDMEEDDIRVEPLGRDCHGNLFYYFPQFFEVYGNLLPE